ncbi:MAG: hypothetical protein ACQ9MH_04870 [Nitrospinales bacterium]
MSCKISVRSWEGDDITAIAEKFAKVFRLSPTKANEILENISLGIAWRFDHTVSDQQGRDAKAFLSSIGFRVELLPAIPKNLKMGLGVNLYADNEEFDEEPIKKSIIARIIEKFSKRRA